MRRASAHAGENVELAAECIAGGPESLRACDPGMVILPGHEKAAVGKTDDASLMLIADGRRVDKYVLAHNSAGIVEHCRPDAAAGIVAGAIGPNHDEPS